MELRNNPKHLSYNYQTETAIFLAKKHEKNNYGMQLFNFLKNISFISNFWPAIL